MTAAEQWREQALCAQTDPIIFHPEPGRSPAVAKRICMACPVRRACKDHALAAPEWWGVWGGLAQNERRRIIRRRRAQAA